jgi:cytochrome c peroxidase
VSAAPAVPLGLPPIPWPADNPYTQQKYELGKLLFFDGRLSANGKVPCSSCHDAGHAFSGDTAFSPGVNGKLTGRHSPTLINRAFGKSQFFDGRAPTIEAQIVIPLTNPNEMGMTVEKAVAAIAAIRGYAPLFAAAFGDSAVTFDRITKSIATFERTILSGNSRYDRFNAGDKNALSKEEKDGMDFFNGKGECSECHSGPDFTNEKFENLGIGMDRRPIDPGREDVTHKRGDMGKFKTPTLRDLASRGPYMHDGRFKTLDEVLDFYAQGGIQNPNVDSRLLQFYMDEKTKASLLAFLNSLNGEGWQTIKAPAAFPQ